MSDLKYITVGRISQERIIEAYSNASAVLDIEHHKQNGLTMRTLEVLGAGLKLITTNKNIRKEDFYSESNVLIIDRGMPNIDKDFLLRRSNIPLSKKYSIESWIKCIFS